MNCGFGNLDTLKRHLLAGSLAGETRFDSVIKTVGLAVAGLIEGHTNRRLGYAAGDTIVFNALRRIFYLPRFPVCGVTSVVTRAETTATWLVESGQPTMVNYETGLVDFGSELGDENVQVRVLWTGGYWFETLEPDDSGYPSSKPTHVDPTWDAVAALPDALQGAWLLQCEYLWAARDKLGMGLVDAPGKQTTLGDLKLSPLVEKMLMPYVRYQMT